MAAVVICDQSLGQHLDEREKPGIDLWLLRLRDLPLVGAGGVTRTRDLTLTKRLLYQLSYASSY